MSPEVRRILDRLPGIDPANAVVTPLPGGLTNRNYRIDTHGGSYALRIGGPHPGLLGIDRQHEHAAAVNAANLGIGPEVVAFLDDESALVTRFIAGAPITPEAAATPGMLARIAASIRRFHSGPPIPGTFSAFECIRRYADRARQRGAMMPTELEDAMTVLRNIETAIHGGLDPVACHNDLLAGNFIDDGTSIRILDWEYAGMGDCFFDLGNFAANLGLDGAGCARLLAAYAGSADPRPLARIRLLQAVSDLRESAWGFLQTSRSTLDVDYTAYGRDHLDRFLARTGHPDFPFLLAAARG